MIADALGWTVVGTATAVILLCLLYARKVHWRNQSCVRMFTALAALLVVLSNVLELAHVVTMAAGVGYLQRTAIIVLLIALAVEVGVDL